VFFFYFFYKIFIIIYVPYLLIRHLQVDLGTKSIVSRTEAEPSSAENKNLVYGPFANVAPFSTAPLTAHFEYARALVEAAEVVRRIRVSHWTGSHFEESYTVVSIGAFFIFFIFLSRLSVKRVLGKFSHASFFFHFIYLLNYHLISSSQANVGAKVVGEWSRYDLLTKGEEELAPSLREFNAAIQAGARNLFFRDRIGNISSSMVRHGSDAVSARKGRRKKKKAT
jgi:hypothetical protein